jgi:hypothetical protein
MFSDDHEEVTEHPHSLKPTAITGTHFLHNKKLILENRQIKGHDTSSKMLLFT